MKKILYTATSDIHLRTFHLPYLKRLKELGFEVHLAYENRREIIFNDADKCFELPFKRSPFSIDNIRAFFRLRKIIKSNGYDIIHCHTPTVSVLTRLAALKAKKRDCKVIYTAHGYHFYKGGPVKLWLLYYPVEKLLSKITDYIVLINREDAQLTEKKFGNKYTVQLNGIGVNDSKFVKLPHGKKQELRKLYGFKSSEFVLLYIAEFIPRKNHEYLIRSVPALVAAVPNVKVVLAGTGPLEESMRDLALELGIENNVAFLGWRDDVNQLSNAVDLGISTSKQEGLGLGLAEQMLCGIPIVATQDRGHREMVVHGKNGFLFPQANTEKFIEYTAKLCSDKELYNNMARESFEKAQHFKVEHSLAKMTQVYRDAINMGLHDNDTKI